MTPLDLAAIEKAAKEATQGEWHSADPDPSVWTEPGMGGVMLVSTEIDDNGHSYAQMRADASFIALANPATILALCERIRELEAGPMRVKPLEWRTINEGPNAGAQSAYTEVGMSFYIKPTDGGFGLERYEGSSTTHSFWTDEAEAKAFAETKLLECIRSALITELQPGPLHINGLAGW